MPKSIERMTEEWLAYNPKGCLCCCQKFPANVHVLGIMSNQGDVMPLHFFKKGETVTKEVFRVLMDIVKP